MRVDVQKGCGMGLACCAYLRVPSFVHTTLHTMHTILHTMHTILHTMHTILHTMHTILHTIFGHSVQLKS